MRRWLLLTIAILALALTATPAMAYIAVKQLPGETISDGLFGTTFYPVGDVYGTLSQTVPIGWTICVHWPYDNNDARANGYIQFPDSILPVSGFGQAGTYWVHTVDTPMGWFDESEDITVLPGFNYYVTINPVIDKMDWVAT